MGENDLSELVCSAVAQAGNIDRVLVRAESRLADLYIDSLALVSLLTQVEVAFNVELTSDEVVSTLDLSTVADLVARVQEILSSRSVSRDR